MSSSSTTITSTSSSSSSTTTTEPDGPPIVAANETWTWIDFPDSTCGDGSPTGIGVNLTNSPNVVLFLGFGGVCWDATTCYVLNTAVHGPYGGSQFTAGVPGLGQTILDRSLPGNPLATWNWVVVPYCTGDFHAGDNVVTYDTGTATHLHYHAGAANLRAFFRRLGPTFPTPAKVLVSGASAGGFGAIFSFPMARARWPQASMYLLSDSGPFLEGTSIANGLVAGAFEHWGLESVTDPVCGEPCRTDPSLFTAAVAARYPGDRMALVSSVQDAVVRNLFGLSASAFEAALRDMTADRLDPSGNFRHFFVAGETHVQLIRPADVSQGGVGLLPWLSQFVGDDPAWASVEP